MAEVTGLVVLQTVTVLPTGRVDAGVLGARSRQRWGVSRCSLCLRAVTRRSARAPSVFADPLTLFFIGDIA